MRLHLRRQPELGEGFGKPLPNNITQQLLQHICAQAPPGVISAT